MNVSLFGATGMVGSGVLIECLQDPRVDSVLAIGRSRSALSHAKLRQIVHDDFFDYTALRDELAGRDACFFCLGVSAAGKSEADYTRLTYDLTMAAARTIADVNPQSVFCYVSGQGTDSTGRARMMWARVKGRTENDLLALPLKAYMFRPGFIQPLKGVRSRTRLYDAIYKVLGPLYPILRRFFPRSVTTSENVSRAMIEVAANGFERRILENPDINGLAARG